MNFVRAGIGSLVLACSQNAVSDDEALKTKIIEEKLEATEDLGPQLKAPDGSYPIHVAGAPTWGKWGTTVECTDGQAAIGFSLKIEESCGGRCDDTSVNQVRLYCGSLDRSQRSQVNSPGGQWGSWRNAVYCPDGMFAYAYRLGYEPKQGDGDDTGANALYMWCRVPGEWRPSDDNQISIIGPWNKSQTGRAVCPFDSLVTGINANIEPRQGRGDDTALNDVTLYCTPSGDLQ